MAGLKGKPALSVADTAPGGGGGGGGGGGVRMLTFLGWKQQRPRDGSPWAFEVAAGYITAEQPGGRYPRAFPCCRVLFKGGAVVGSCRRPVHGIPLVHVRRNPIYLLVTCYVSCARKAAAEREWGSQHTLRGTCAKLSGLGRRGITGRASRIGERTGQRAAHLFVRGAAPRTGGGAEVRGRAAEAFRAAPKLAVRALAAMEATTILKVGKLCRGT